ncbi:hypothetical protein BDV98DRAFT_549553 [Pterulicium gracile]|uniref:EamA domain-containing protein n=1 Tax=Pterulicium gracile TaxID=1884261 RepID=A0A5C3QID8_9AGAR|nr:hypothetical protein BDV98DRAFT_549553 [Pterula gracilis]
MTTSGQPSAPGDAQGSKLKNVVATLIFAIILIAFTVESELTQYVQSRLDFRQPFFIFYAVHSGFIIIFPLHLAYLLFSGYTVSALKASLTLAINDQFTPSYSATERLTAGAKKQLLILIVGLTTAYTVPAVLWFAAISLASVTDVTAIYNTNAFFAYLFSVRFFNLKWDPIKLFAVCLATLGTLCVVYALSTSTSLFARAEDMIKPTFPLLGHMLTFIASIAYGLYQVLYKRYAALPSETDTDETGGAGGGAGYQPITSGEHDRELNRQLHSAVGENPWAESINNTWGSSTIDEDVPSPPPFGLHPNFITSSIGLATLVLGAPLLLAAHYGGIEEFRMPPDWSVGAGILGIMASGITFNAGFMILLSLWGPVVVSVGNLLTIVLVFVSDILFGAGMSAVTIWSVVGSVGIMAAFGVLVTAGV